MNNIETRHPYRADDRASPDAEHGEMARDPGFYDEQIERPILAEIRSAVFRNRWLIAAIIGASVAAGIAVTLLTAPVYNTRASVQVDQRTARVLGTEEQDTAQSAADSERFLQTQVDILRSKSLASRVASKLKLSGDVRFADAVGLDHANAGSDSAVVAALQRSLSVSLPRTSRVIGVSFSSRNPEISADIANAFVVGFVEGNLQRKFDQSAYARDFLKKQLDDARVRLEASEVELNAFARSANLIDASAGATASSTEAGPRSLITASLIQANQAHSLARTTRLQTESKWRQTMGRPLMSLPEVLSNPAVQELAQKRAELQSAYEQDRKRYKANYPTVVQSAAAIQQLDKEISTLAQSIKQSIENAYLVALEQENAATRERSSLESRTRAEQDRSVLYGVRKRETDTNRQLYDALLQRYKEVSAEAGATNNNISIIDRADPPQFPTYPKPLQNLALAGLAGLLLAAIATFARERFDDSIRLPQDVDLKLRLPLLAAIPLAKGSTTPIEALDEPKSGLVEAFQSLRTALEFTSTQNNQARTVLLTSSRQGEGKSTTAFGLARALASPSAPVVLVDADLRKPSLHRYLGCENAVGLSNVLAGTSLLSAVTQNTEIPGLDLITSGPIPPNPAQLLIDDTLPDLLEHLLTEYRYVILDAPPVMGLADAPRLASIADVTIFAVEADGAHRGAAKAALRRLRDAHANIVGAVLTKFDAQKLGYGRYDDYYAYDYGGSASKKSR